MKIREVMTDDLVTVPLERSLHTAVENMLEHRVGSVLVTAGQEYVGIITETDVLALGVGFEQPFADIPVSRAMSEPLVTIEAGARIDDAVETMHEYRIKKLPVTESEEVVGVLTMTDLVYHHAELVPEAKKLEADRDSKTADAPPDT